MTATELARWFAERFFRPNPALQDLHFIESDARQPHRFEPRTPLPTLN